MTHYVPHNRSNWIKSSKKIWFSSVLACTFSVVAFWACKRTVDTPIPLPHGEFPDEVAQIFISKCATSGCHNAQTRSSGINLESWDELFKGGYNGSIVVPYRPDLSSLMYYINTDDSRGPVAVPTMPINETPLNEYEYNVIYNWIKNGAPNKSGEIPFKQQLSTSSILYLAMQACDEIGIIDAQSGLLMRSITAGLSPAMESVHTIRVSPNGERLYVSLLRGSVMQVYNTQTNTLEANIELGNGFWNVFHISADSRYMILADWQPSGGLKKIDLQTLEVINLRFPPPYTSGIPYPHGITSNQAFDTFYVCLEYSNVMAKFALNDRNQISDFELISLDGNPPTIRSTQTNSPETMDPHEVDMLPGDSLYAVSCQSTNEVRIMSTKTNTCVKILNVGKKPLEITRSQKYPYMAVACSEDDTNPNFGYRGSVFIFNYKTLEPVTTIYGKFFQPHGIAFDDENDQIFVASRNISLDGPAPHHSSECGGRNGFYHAIKLGTWQQVGPKHEVLPDPYSFQFKKR